MIPPKFGGNRSRLVAVARTHALFLAVALVGVCASPAFGDEDRVEVSDLGSVVVTVTADRATVFIDDELRGTTTIGTSLTISLPEGTYRLAVEAEGYARFERAVTVRSGEKADVEAPLAPKPRAVAAEAPLVPSEAMMSPRVPSKRVAWRNAFLVSSAVLVAGVATTIYSIRAIEDAEKHLCTGGYNCGPFGVSPADRDKYNRQGERAETLSYISMPVTLLAVIAVGITGINWKLHDSKEKDRKRHMAVAPILGPDTAGATFHVRW